jgi:ketosteroid isomerase-like protein
VGAPETTAAPAAANGKATPPPSEAALRWVQRFTENWANPQPDRWLEQYRDLLDPEVRLIQPLTPPTQGLGQFKALFDGIFALIPDLRGRVERWSATGDEVYIELTLYGTLGGRPIAWRACDRCSLRDGLVVERESYWDPTPVLTAAALRPKAWPSLVRSGTATATLKGLVDRARR